jgi:hypothetical protein
VNDEALDMRMHLLREARGEAFAAGQAAERARCIKALEDLRDTHGWGPQREGLRAAITALSETPTPPVASSPVGGQQ